MDAYLTDKVRGHDFNQIMHPNDVYEFFRTGVMISRIAD